MTGSTSARKESILKIGFAAPLCALVVFLVVTGCSNDGLGDNGRGQWSDTSTDPALVAEATDFGGIVLPPGATVLLAHTEGALDTLYQLSLSMNPTGLDQLLADSHFGSKRRKDYPPYEPVLAGPSLASSPLVTSMHDTYSHPDGKTVFRVIVVDERDPSTRIVHLEMNTT